MRRLTISLENRKDKMNEYELDEYITNYAIDNRKENEIVAFEATEYLDEYRQLTSDLSGASYVIIHYRKN